MRRILYVHNSADLYGASRSLLRLLRVLDRSRFEPIVVLPECGFLEERLRALDIRVQLDPSLAIVSRYSSKIAAIFLRFPVSVLRLVRLIRRERIDLVHTNSGVIFSPACAAFLAGVPHVWHVRESFEEFRGGAWGIYAKYMTSLSSRIISVSAANASQFSSRKKIDVIHNGFLLDDFELPSANERLKARQSFGFDDSELVVGCVGRLKWVRKGQEYLVQAASLVKQRDLRAKYLIVGAPYTGNEEHQRRLQALVHELDLSADVLFTGELQDTRPAYAAMDLFVLPSALSEPFGGVVMEAMAYALPVIATNIGGSLDQVENEVTGFLVPSANPSAIAEKILFFLQNGDCIREMGLAGRRRIAEKFDLQQMTRRVETLYQDLLSKRS